VERKDLRISGDRIIATGKRLTVVPGETVIDLNGRIVMPGMVNAHTHLYSSLVRGMPGPRAQPKTFTELLQRIWWKLDRALDEESIYYSALIGAIEAARFGTTSLIDHHASPNAIPGSLDLVQKAMSDVGLRGVLCYEVSDRDGMKRRDQGLEENERFLSRNSSNAQFRGLVGAHASFTLSDESLHRCGEIAARHNTGVHIHVAEALDDASASRKKYHRGVIERLSKFDIPRKHSIFAHAVHLVPKEYKQLQRTGTWFVHNPRSNMNNRVGQAPIEWFGERAALGTDGFPADMFSEAATGFYRLRDAHSPADAVTPAQFLANGPRLVSEIFHRTFGSLEKDSVADLIVLNYLPPTPLTDENIISHLLFGMNSSSVESVMVAGKWIVRDREVLGVDMEQIYRKASEVGKKLWKRSRISE
ncbi:MAG TPA: putative aminohydrolase SsnA, partial [Bacteroidota bacterium]|nr:putative aminohydrolase SsnA [Bacteroidota bacterium]